jgi:SAM-dependent methyltransferase
LQSKRGCRLLPDDFPNFYDISVTRFSISLDSIPHRLHRGVGGCWFASTSESISYPADGNESCFAVEDHSFWFQHRNACLLALMESLPPCGTLFDVGGGNGVVAAAMQASGFDTVLVEPGLQGALNARRRGVGSVVCARLEDVGFPTGILPAIGLFDVLEHIEDDRSFLRTLSSLLQPRGRLYLTVPAYRSLWSAEDVHAGHYRRYSLGGLKRLLGEAGFRIDFASYLFWLLPVPIFIQRTLPSLLLGHLRVGRDQVRRDHVPTTSNRGRVLESLLRREIAWIRARRRIPIGSSCLVTAVLADVV